MKTLLLALAAILCAATAAEAQFTYDWSTGGRSVGTRLEAGRRNDILVSGLNPLCYTTHVRLTTIDARVDFGGFAASLSAPTQPKSILETLLFTPALPTDDMPLTEQPAAVRIARAAEYADAASYRIERVRAALDELTTYVKTLDDPPCGSGRGWIRAFQEEWDSRRVHLRGVVTSADTALASAVDFLAIADTARHQIARETNLSVAEEQQLNMLQGQINRISAELTTTRGLLTPAMDKLQRVWQRMEALRNGMTVRNHVYFSHDIERVKLVITTIPLEGTDAPAVPPDTVEEPVLRRFRLFVSTGMFASLMRHRDYERTNRPLLRDSTTAEGGTVRVPTDSTYETFVNRRGGWGDVVSPNLQLNMVFTDVQYPGSGWPVMVSFGAAARSVGGSTLPEPFFGGSLGINDRILFSFGAHYGRNETLLLTLPGEQPEDVAERRVPKGISTDDAVGTKWMFAPYFTISVKL